MEVDIGKKLESLRSHFGEMSQEALAEIAKCSLSSMKSYENGRNQPPFSVLRNICAHFKMERIYFDAEQVTIDDAEKLFLHKRMLLVLERLPVEEISALKMLIKARYKEIVTKDQTAMVDELLP